MKTNTDGFTLIEAIIALSILAVAIIPLMSMMTLSAHINNESSREFKSLMEAQRIIEEFKSADVGAINEMDFSYNADTGCYEKHMEQTESEYGSLVRITQGVILYRIEVFVLDKGEIINYIEGSRIAGGI
ncbi:MAG TPA: hypothetical protein DEF04_09540 [Clostridiales bacterium]|nr:hypothetical protein [Clostridiales bacterium]